MYLIGYQIESSGIDLETLLVKELKSSRRRSPMACFVTNVAGWFRLPPSNEIAELIRTIRHVFPFRMRSCLHQAEDKSMKITATETGARRPGTKVLSER